MRRSTRHVTRPSRRPRRWIFAVACGILLGLVAVLFLTRIYNPLGTSIEDPLVLIPADVDFVLRVPDFPEFVRELDQRSFVERLAGSERFEAFMQLPEIRRRGLLHTLRDALQQLDAMQGRMPLGLDLLGDVSGTQVVLAGYMPARVDDPWPFICIFRPDSWLTLAGANILLDEQLCGWFLKDNIESEGIRIDHQRDLVRLKLARGRDLFVTRIGDAVVVSSEGDQLGMIHNVVQTQGVPTEPAPRFLGMTAGLEGTGSEVHLLFDRQAADRLLEVSDTLDRLWGPDTVELVESLLPRPGGRDFLLRADINVGLTLELSMTTEPPREGDFGPLIRLTTRSDLDRFLRRDCRFVPEDAFGVVYLGASAGEVLERVTERKDFLPDDVRKLLDEELARIPGIGSLEGLTRKLDEVVRQEVGLIFFKQPREALKTLAQPGYLVVAPLEDEAEALRILETVRRRVLESRGEGALKDMVRREEEGIRIYELLPAAGVVDDARVTRPGLAFVAGHLVLTNYHPYLERFARVLREEEPSLADNAGLMQASGNVPESLQVSFLMDFGHLFDYVHQSLDGWAFARTDPNRPDLAIAERERLEETASRLGYRRGSRDFDAFVEQRFQQWKTRMVAVDRHAVRKDMEDVVKGLEGVFSSLGVFVEVGGSEATFTLRLDVPDRNDHE